MLVSIVVCIYSLTRYTDLLEAIQSLKNQTYVNTEIIVVIDGSKDVYNKLISDNIKLPKLILLTKNLGLSQSRNAGIKVAKGDIIAFLDDDAVADENWIQELVNTYDKSTLAVGGKILPLWLSKKPSFLPEEFYWLIGATHKDFPEQISEVRNTFGSNISFRADVFQKLGGFKSNIGIKGRSQLQAEEVDLCERMRQKYGKGVIYNPSAIVYHKVFSERLKLKFLLRRAFWQGYSKRMLKKSGYQIKEEQKYLNSLVGSVIERILQTLFIVIFSFVVGLGYIYRYAKR